MLLDNRYEVNPQDKIGKGGFATVYRAVDTKFGMTVALKHYTSDKGKAGSVTAEIKKCIQFNHPNIIRYFDCFETQHSNSMGETITEEYGVMEYANAGSLSDIINGKREVSDDEFKSIILGILDGLHYLHTLPTPIIHRDLKPGNILLQEQNGQLIPKICDFGISKEWQDMTKTGTTTGMVGTMEYMAPEQLAGRGIQPGTDLWALGCIIFEYFCGQPPFGKVSNGTSVPALNTNILNATYSSTQLNKIPEPFKALVKGCLVKEVDKRVRSVEEAKALLLGRSKPTAPTPPFNWKALSIAIFVIIGVLFIYNFEHTSENTDVFENTSETPFEEVVEKTTEIPTAIEPPPPAFTDENQAEQQNLAEERAVIEQQRQELERQKAEVERSRQFELERQKAEAERSRQLELERQRQQAEAERLRQQHNTSSVNNPASATAPIKKLINDMIFVSGGTFVMGCTSEQGGDCGINENPTHTVTLSSYYICKYEVTQTQWRALMNNNPSRFSACDDCPVENVSWNEVQDFIKKLNSMTGQNFRLPTEAEWEFAARGGNSSRGFKYSGSNSLRNIAWYSDNSNSKTHPVGQKLPNELGLYDMSGNVLEWCNDRNGDYSNSKQTNPRGSFTGSDRMIRGGSWINDPRGSRVSFRNSFGPNIRFNSIGFRLARD